MSSDQRKVKNFINTSGLSKNYYGSVFAGGIAFLGILMAYASHQLSQVSAMTDYISDPNVASAFQDRLLSVAIVVFVSFMVFLGSTVFYLIILGQRVGGAAIAIVAYIKELKNGNYDSKRELRKNDELGVVMQELRELSEVLKRQKN